ncbi:MAG: phage holin family protein [Chitinophagaceae bacterium]|nr:MAG: phage holin family protein [Chitinophagaceae bacterium]
MNFIIRLLITAAVAYGLSMVLSGVQIPKFTDAIILAIVLALLNTFVKPILLILTFPITVLTLGLFLFVVNALIILLADKLMDGITISGFWWALLFSLLLSIVSSFVQSLVGKKD